LRVVHHQIPAASATTTMTPISMRTRIGVIECRRPRATP
jgi:hypothetical protein